jgi:hypothetical protein
MKWFVIALLSVGCSEPKLATSRPNVADACQNLRALGCSEGATECERSVELILADRIEPFDVSCVAYATDIDSVRACPTIRCER